MSRRYFQAAAVAAVIMVLPMLAHTPGSRIAIESCLPSQDGQMRLHTTINFSVPGSTRESDHMPALRARALSVLKEMLGQPDDVACDAPMADQSPATLNTNVTATSKSGPPDSDLGG